jgi:acyl dehydratase
MSIERLKPADLGAHVGEVFGVSSWIVVDQHRINEFARCTDDRQWIHVDVERATRESPFGGTVAHGFLTLALLAPTIFEVMLSRVEARQAINYGLERVRFLSPVRAGRRVRNRLKKTLFLALAFVHMAARAQALGQRTAFLVVLSGCCKARQEDNKTAHYSWGEGCGHTQTMSDRRREKAAATDQ